ncbi:MAG: tetratricopeptide repeat protein [Planctomycetes bacterium]|nr:tetratricopeptide repeat protein [Planctomycetota bacterium]
MTQVPCPAPASPWILGPWRDSVLFLATPVLIVPLTMALVLGIPSQNVVYLVLAFGAMGHNLPGMLRAYGDRALFRRFALRFVLAPLVLGVVCFDLTFRGSSAIAVIALLWSVWHALMQIYGFLRIYDAKVGAHQPANAWLDFWMCLAWFAGALLVSDSRTYYVQSLAGSFGFDPLSASTLQQLRGAALVALGALTCGYVVHQVVRMRAGAPINLRKNVLLLAAIVTWWYANVFTQDVMLGLVMFEVFHDVQYLAIVWLFNRRRAAADDAGGFTRFLFRSSWGMVGLYVGLVLAYGAFMPLTRGLAERSASWSKVISALVLTSAMLHYYFDGFIWKVREVSTSRDLGIAARSGRELGTGALRHAAKWLLLLVPVLVVHRVDERPASLATAEALAASTPGAARAQRELGKHLAAAERLPEAIAALQRSIRMAPTDAEARDALGVVRVAHARGELRSNKVASAERLLREAAADKPQLADELSNRGLLQWRLGQRVEAIVELRCALLVDPRLASAHLNLALVYRDSGSRELALAHAKRGAELRPGDAEAQKLLRELEGSGR